MRKVTFGVANSLDNFIARANGAVDWLLWSDEVTELIGDFWQKVDTVLMGRKTYTVALDHNSGSNPYKNVNTYVFSRTMKKVAGENVEIITGDAVEFVRNLKMNPGKNICCIGGGEFARSLFEADLIDEVGVNIHPVVLGSGIPLFHSMNRQIDLELIEFRKLKNNCVYLLYSVKK